VLHPDSASSAQNAEAIKASVAMCITALGPQSNQRVVVQATGAPAAAAAAASLATDQDISSLPTLSPALSVSAVFLYTDNPRHRHLVGSHQLSVDIDFSKSMCMFAGCRLSL
jgi:hypothetical protein